MANKENIKKWVDALRSGEYMKIMNPDVKRVWLKELRSGKYDQGKGHLNLGGRYCCLGVLCEIAVENEVIARSSDQNESSYGTPEELEDHDGATAYPPKGVVDWAGLPSENPKVTYEHCDMCGPGTRALSELNDDEELSFEEIADIIEEQL